jgi:single-strand DNA-binding protein
MNAIRNSVRLLGHVGQDPEIKEFDGGNKLVRFSLATNDSYVDKKGEKQNSTEWHNLIAWGKSAELIHSMVKKGSEIAVEGAIQTRSYEKDGEKKYTTEIVISEFVVFGKKD